MTYFLRAFAKHNWITSRFEVINYKLLGEMWNNRLINRNATFGRSLFGVCACVYVCMFNVLIAIDSEE